MIEVLLVEDQPIYRTGLRGALTMDPQIQVIGEASNGLEAVKKLESQSVDIVLLDVNMPVQGGLKTVPQIQEKWPNTGIIMLTVYDEAKLIQKFLDMDVDGYLLKEAEGRDIREAIKMVASGGTYYGAEVMKIMSRYLREQMRNPLPEVHLTQREREVLQLIIEEHTAPEIANALFISLETVSSHRKNIREKLKVRNTAGIVREALRMGLADVNNPKA
ncbi:MAG: response regulator transcription factor [Bacteroidota bacterium]